MSFLSFDLDAKKRAQRAARAAGVDPGIMVWGLLELWEHCWLERVDVVSTVVLHGCFGHAPEVPAALATFGFLEAQGEAWRVRGAQRYLRVSTARSQGGQARAAGPRNARGQLLPSSHPAGPGPADQQNTSPTPSTEHRTPEEPKEEEAPPPPPDINRAMGALSVPAIVAGAAPDRRDPANQVPPIRERREQPPPGFSVVPPTTEPEEWTGEDFWRWAQSIRAKARYPPEKRPRASLSSWWSACLMQEGITPRALQAGFLKFGQSDFWEAREPPFPFHGFMSEWSTFTRMEAPDEAHAG